MKNFKILSLAILALFMFSCESDDDNEPTLSNATIAGTYNVTAVNGSGTDVSTFNGMTETETFTIAGSNFNNTTFTFTEAGTVTTDGTFTITAVYTEDGVSDTEVEVTDIDLDGTYTISGNNISFSEDDDVTVTVRNFTSNGLQLFVVESETDADGSFESETTITLVRQ